MRPYERFINYVKIWTTSDGQSSSVPSTEREFDLANLLVKEMKEIGVEDAHVDEKCYVYGTIPATKGYESVPAVGFCAHLDTADFNGKDVKPCLIENYDGSDVALGDSGRILSVKLFPDLLKHVGKTLITTDGTTLLGADDKAGIAEIMTMTERLITENISHGKVCLSFTPDEEVGAGADDLDIPKLGAYAAYTVDGGDTGIVQYENFNAAGAKIKIQGVGVHPGDAKNVMVNALAVAVELNNMLPSGETPRDTQGYEGFFHLDKIDGTPEEAVMEYIIRDHDKNLFEGRKKTLAHIVELLTQKYGEGTASLSMEDQYYNMEPIIKEHFELIENAKKATEMAGVPCQIVPVRGGTDGARLSYRGLPCPNLGTGGWACHGPYEHITVEDMDVAADILVNIVKLYGDTK